MADFAFDLDSASVLFDDAVRHREAQTGSLAHIFGGKERIKNLTKILRRDPFARIGDFKIKPGFVRCRAGADAQDAPGFHGLNAV